MKDLTRGSITVHILTMASPVAISMLAGIACHLINLYFLSQIGAEATAGVNAAGTATMIITALTQVLGTGTLVLISHSIGRKDPADTNLIFNQSMALALVCAVLTILTLCVFVPPYMTTVSREPATIEAGIRYVLWSSPACALLFPLLTLSSTLRGAGVVRPTILLFSVTPILNALLAPLFIAGWGFGMNWGVMGAGLATSLSVAVGFGCMWAYFFASQKHIGLHRSLLYPQRRQWQRILAIGWPAGGEFALQFLTGSVVYFLIRDMGASAQAGFGIGLRIVQTILLPGMAVAQAASPIAGQSFGAGDARRVHEVFWTTTVLSTLVMLAATALVLLWPEQLVGFFDTDASTAATAVTFIQIMSWTFIAEGLVFTCTFLFQSLGNTVPSLISAIARFIIFAGPALWLARSSNFDIDQLWYLLTASVAVQAALGAWLLRLEFQRKLQQLAQGVGTLVYVNASTRPMS